MEVVTAARQGRYGGPPGFHNSSIFKIRANCTRGGTSNSRFAQEGGQNTLIRRDPAIRDLQKSIETCPSRTRRMCRSAVTRYAPIRVSTRLLFSTRLQVEESSLNECLRRIFSRRVQLKMGDSSEKEMGDSSRKKGNLPLFKNKQRIQLILAQQRPNQIHSVDN